MVRRKQPEQPAENNGTPAVIERARPPAPAELYTMRWWCDAPVRNTGEPAFDFIDDIRGSVLFHHNGRRQRIGRFLLHRVRLAEAWQHGWSPCDVLGAHSCDLTAIGFPLLDPENGDLRESIKDKFYAIGVVMTVLNRVEILPEHRGNGLGLAVVDRLLDTLCPPTELVVTSPVPIQFLKGFDDAARRDQFAARLQMDQFTTSPTRAISKLRRYWSKLGFQRLDKTDVYVLSTAYKRPPLETAGHAALS